MTDLPAVLADLAAECGELDALVAPLAAEQWATRTPAPGWTVATQIAHLAWTDDIATLAATDPQQFQAELSRALGEIDGYTDRAAAERAQQPAAELLRTWRAGRSALAGALSAMPQAAKLPWFGPPMSPITMATARLMETWAHGQDVFDALGRHREPTSRLRHVAHIGVRTRDFAFLVHDLPVPAEPFRYELTAADGELWTWGPADAGQRITGPALDFCLLVTQRRHPDDLAVEGHGADAHAWIAIAQAFAGPPGDRRKPGDGKPA